MTNFEFLTVMKCLRVILEREENESAEAVNFKARRFMDYVIRQAEDDSKNDK